MMIQRHWWYRFSWLRPSVMRDSPHNGPIMRTAFPRHGFITLQWRHNERDSVSNHQPHDCLLNRLFRRRSKKISKPRVIGLCAGNSPGTGEFPARMASNAENVSIGWRHHDHGISLCIFPALFVPFGICYMLIIFRVHECVSHYHVIIGCKAIMNTHYHTSGTF